MYRLCLVCLGGAIGTGARYLIATTAPRLFGTSFPYGTLAVNLIAATVVLDGPHLEARP